MTLDELLSKKNLNFDDMDEYVRTTKIKNISQSDLEKLLYRFPFALSNQRFEQLYYIASANATNRAMKFWTITIGILTQW